MGASRISAPRVGARALTARHVLRSQVCHRPGLLRAAAEVVMTRTDPAAMAEAMRLLAAAVACPPPPPPPPPVLSGHAASLTPY